MTSRGGDAGTRVPLGRGNVQVAWWGMEAAMAARWAARGATATGADAPPSPVAAADGGPSP
jgi:hypothetical protein